MAEHAEVRSGSGFFAARWRSEVSLDRIFFIDMLLVATAINVAAALVSLMMFGLKLPAWAAIAVYLAPLPYNVFLTVAVWRTADRSAFSAAAFYRLGALVWLAVSVLV
jgi:hypothetical protein